MIFHLHCGLIMAGYSAVGLLLGGYMLRYADAQELELGFIFMVQPLTIFLRPLICARADRYRSHKTMLAWFLLGTALAYLPFIAVPYLVDDYGASALLAPRARFWVLVAGHLLGSVCFCGIRSLGDAAAVNYAKRTGSDYANYRKYGSISFGLCGYLLGQVNQGWLLPDFVPSFVVYCAAMALEALLVYLWPDEHFYMVGAGDDAAASRRPLPSGRAVARHMGAKLWRTLTCRRAPAAETAPAKTAAETPEKTEKTPAKRPLSVRTQARIFLLLVSYDYRIGAYMLVLLYGGLVGYAPPNFVFTHMDKLCRERGTCNGAALAGLVMMAYCAVETACYVALDALRHRLARRRLALLQLTLLSLAVHFNFYGYALDHVSAYFFLVECLHGLEYSISLSSCMEFGYEFASEVGVLMPELRRRGIVGPDDDHDLVRVSLMATMSGCFTLVYDGLGTIVGSLLIGLVVGAYSFTAAWRLVGALAAAGFVAVLVAALAARWARLRPAIEQLRSADSNPTESA